jgi:hypothetical protein
MRKRRVGTAMLYAKAMGRIQPWFKTCQLGDVTVGDKTRVVGYSSLLFIKK